MKGKREPQAAYSCFIIDFKHKPSCIIRTIPNISDQLNQLDGEIISEFKRAITGGIHCSDIERQLLSLSSKLGGLGILIFAEILNQEYEYSLMLSKDLLTRILKQEIQLSSENDVQNIIQKLKAKSSKNIKQKEDIRYFLTEEQTRLIKNMDHPVD